MCFWFAGAHFRVGCVMLLLLTVCNGKFYKISVCSSYRIFVSSLRTMPEIPGHSIKRTSANSAKFRGTRPRMNIRICFDNAGDNATLTLYNVTLTSDNPFLTQKQV